MTASGTLWQPPKTDRLGASEQLFSIDFQVIATSNQELQEQVGKKRSRADLYHRLQVLSLEIRSRGRSNEPAASGASEVYNL